MINQRTHWGDTGSEPAAGTDDLYAAGEQPIAEYDNWFNYSATKDIEDLAKQLSGTVLNRGNASGVNVTETALTEKQDIQPNNDFIGYIERINVVCNNPSGSGCTLYFILRALLDDDSETDLLDAEESVSEGNSFDDWLIDVMENITSNHRVKEVRLYAYCSTTPAGGSEPTVQLKRVLGVQN